MKPTKSKTRIAPKSRGYNAAGKWDTESLSKPAPRRPATTQLTDTQIVEVLSTLWGPGTRGAFICGHLFVSEAGSFRDAVNSFYYHENKKAKR